MSKSEITIEQARRILEVVDAGLCRGLGEAEPGKMCVEAAVTFALGENFGDQPSCVHPVVRAFKIKLNDSDWSSDVARARGMRRIAIAQLGTAENFDAQIFVRDLVFETIRQILPIALHAAASVQTKTEHRARLDACAIACEEAADLEAAKIAAREGRIAAAAAYAAAAYAAYATYAADAADAAAAAYAAADAAADAADAAYAAAAADADAADAADAAYATYAADAAAAAYAAADARKDSTADRLAAKDKILSLAAEIGVQALRVAGAAGVKLMEKLCS